MLPQDISRQQRIDHLIAIRNQSLKLAALPYLGHHPEPPIAAEEARALREATTRMRAARWRMVPIGAALVALGVLQVFR